MEDTPSTSPDREDSPSESAAPAEPTIEDRFKRVLDPVTKAPVGKRLQLRLRKLGHHQRDEVMQFQLLQKACRESEELKNAFLEAGLRDPTEVNRIRPTAEDGAMIQAFNAYIETHWRGARY